MIIAEIGQNHCGDSSLARYLINQARVCGADLVKFQLYDHKKLYVEHPEVPNVELSFEQTKAYFEYGKEIGIEVFFSVFDVERVKWCEKIGVKRYKIASSVYKLWKIDDDGEILEAIAATGKEMIASIPYGDFVGFPMGDGKRLWCIPEYPTSSLSLAGVSFGEIFDGFSDHTIGLDAAKIALARGAQIIEKHFAIDHRTGVDAEWSMTPMELRELKRWEGICKQVL